MQASTAVIPFEPVAATGLAVRRFGDPVQQRIAGFHQDEEGDWVAELECGHSQHMRHDPPWQVRTWVTTDEGRRSRCFLRCLGISPRS